MSVRDVRAAAVARRAGKPAATPKGEAGSGKKNQPQQPPKGQSESEEQKE